MGVVDEVVIALNGRNWLATALGFIAGGVVPVATYLEAHHDVDPSRPLHAQVTTYLVLGGLVFSAKTVFRWATRAFADGWKAAGFVVLLEGVMITSHVPVLPLVLLAILVAVNGIATGCTLSVERSRARGIHRRRPSVPTPTSCRSPPQSILGQAGNATSSSPQQRQFPAQRTRGAVFAPALHRRTSPSSWPRPPSDALPPGSSLGGGVLGGHNPEGLMAYGPRFANGTVQLIGERSTLTNEQAAALLRGEAEVVAIDSSGAASRIDALLAVDDPLGAYINHSSEGRSAESVRSERKHP
jgi:hypothetical protein